MHPLYNYKKETIRYLRNLDFNLLYVAYHKVLTSLCIQDFSHVKKVPFNIKKPAWLPKKSPENAKVSLFEIHIVIHA